MAKIGPEKIVERLVLQWCLSKGWSVDVYDSKATYSEYSKSYKKSRSLKQGTPDLIGNDCDGRSVYIELKAPKVDYCSQEQFVFLRKKIETNAFACVINEVDKLEKTYHTWRGLVLYSEYEKARCFLLSCLPRKIKVNGRIISVS